MEQNFRENVLFLNFVVSYSGEISSKQFSFDDLLWFHKKKSLACAHVEQCFDENFWLKMMLQYLLFNHGN